MSESFDQSLRILFVVGVIGLPAIGYWLTILDVRAYLRALRGMLVRVAQPMRHKSDLPEWVQSETPPCLRAMGLSLPCSEGDLKEAYRRLAKELHPDRGGDVQRFLMLQTHMEQATHFLAQRRERAERES